MSDMKIAEPADIKTPRFCWTVVGMPVHQNKILMVKHKKLGIWLCPGGHMEEGELPHHAAERECFEETGVRTRAVSALNQPASTDTEYLPSPRFANLHWICQENYDARLASNNPTQPHPSTKWPRGCEQHFSFLYLLELVGSDQYTQNLQETDGIGWFTADEVRNLDTIEGIREEVVMVLKSSSTIRVWNN